MKKFSNYLLIFLMLAAIGAGVLLVKQNQETRRGAASATVNGLFVPDTKSLAVGDTFSTYFKLSTGTIKIVALDTYITFDKDKFILVSVTPIASGSSELLAGDKALFNWSVGGNQGWTALNQSTWVTDGSTNGKFRLQAWTNEGVDNLPYNVLDVMKLTFVAKAAGTAVVGLESAQYGTNESTAMSTLVSSSATYTIAATTATCTDSDSGKDYAVTGTTCSAGECSTDSCNAAGLIHEYYCDGTAVAGEVVDCGTGKTCSGGKCVTAETTTTSPTPTMTSTPTMTPSPTPTEPVTTNGTDSVLRMKVSYKGIVANGQCIGNMASIITVNGNGSSAVYTDVVPSQDTSVTDKGVFVYNMLLSGFSQKDNVAVFVKGPKHIQAKYGIDSQSSMYNQAAGQLILTADEDSPLYDFTNYPDQAGDINQDGKVNSVDFGLEKTDLLTHKSVDAGGDLETDLDGDCVVTSNDMQLLRQTLDEKQSQLY